MNTIFEFNFLFLQVGFNSIENVVAGATFSS